jgi:hypothetical protein
VLRPWQPGQSGNPSGKGALFQESQRLCREHSPRAARRLIELMESEDERVSFMAAKEVWERAWGKVPDYNPADDENRPAVDVSSMSVADQKRLLQLFRQAARGRENDVSTT